MWSLYTPVYLLELDTVCFMACILCTSMAAIQCMGLFWIANQYNDMMWMSPIHCVLVYIHECNQSTSYKGVNVLAIQKTYVLF